MRRKKGKVKGQKVDEMIWQEVISDWLMAMGWDPISVHSSKDRLPHREGGE